MGLCGFGEDVETPYVGAGLEEAMSEGKTEPASTASD